MNKRLFAVGVISVVVPLFIAGAAIAVRYNIHAIVWVIAACFNISLAGFVYFKNRSSSINRSFALFDLAKAVWTIGVFGLYVAQEPAFALRWARLTSAGAIFCVPTFFHFVLSLTRDKSVVLRRLLLLSYVMAFFFLLNAGSGLFIESLVRTPFKFAPRPGIIYQWWLANFAIWVGYSLVHVFKTLRRTQSPLIRGQLKYFFLAAATVSLFSLQNVLVSYKITTYPLGGLANIVYSSIVAYAIVKYQLMDIRVIIKKSIIYFSLTMALAGMYALLVGTANIFFGFRLLEHSVPFIINGIAGALTALVFLPLKNKIQNIVDRLFFRDKYDYQKTLRSFSDDLTSLFEQDVLLDLFSSRVMDTMHIEQSYIMLADEEKEVFEIKHVRGARARVTAGESIPFTHPLAFWICENKTSSVPFDNDGPWAHYLQQQDIHAVFPLVTRQKVIGFIALGRKLSEEIYFHADRELLMTLANHLAIALENAQLSANVRSLERSLHQADKMSALGTFASSIAHEIKNPLASIKTFSQLVDRKAGDPKFIASFSDVVPKEIERMETILSRMLDFTRFSEVHYGDVRVDKLIDEVLELIHYELFKNNVRIRKAYTDIPQIRASEKQLKQVFLNLALNAIHAMPSGGELSIHTAPVARDGASWVEIQVSDTGCGIAPENISKLFKPFFTTKFNGTGLGLSIVRRLIREHGGTIEVQSEENVGTRFTIQIPLVTSPS